MTTNNDAILEDLYYEVAMAEPSERIDLLDELTRTHPEHARELTDFAVALALDDVKLNSSVPEPVGDDDPLVMKAMSRLQNRLYDVGIPSASQRSLLSAVQEHTTVASPPNPFAQMTRVEMRAFAKQLGADVPLIVKFRDRIIRPETIPKGVVVRSAELLGVSEAHLAAHFAGTSEVRRDTFFNSSQKPEAARQETFADAISDLTSEQQAYLLSL